MAKKISDLISATQLGDNDSFVFNDVVAGNDKRVTASSLRADADVVKVATVADLRNLEGKRDGQVVELLGYYLPGDGCGGVIYWDATSTENDNGGTIFRPNSIGELEQGRFKRPEKDYVSILHFGARKGGVIDATSEINKAKIQSSNMEKALYIPPYKFLYTGELEHDQSIFGVFGFSEIIHNPTEEGLSCLKLLNCTNKNIDSVIVRNEGDTSGSFGTGDAFSLAGCKDSEIKYCYVFSNFNSARMQMLPSVTNPMPATMVAGSFVILESSENCSIHNCGSKTGTYTGIRIDNSKRCEAYQISIYDSQRGYMLSGQETDINSAQNNSIHHCNFEECHQSGGKIEYKCINNKVYLNRFIDCLKWEVDNGLICAIEAELSEFSRNYIDCPNIHASHPYMIRIGASSQDNGQGSKIIENEVINCANISCIFVNLSSDVTIKANKINNVGGIAIQAEDCSDLKTVDNIISDCDGEGITFSNTLEGAQILNNTVKRCFRGININTNIVGNHKKVNCSYNETYDCTDVGILINRQKYFNCTHNICEGNTVADLRVQNSEDGSYDHNFYGSLSSGSNTNVVSSNNIITT